jgi:prepilin-type N-terminal cleavage/methylation domain-containing protein
MRNRRGFTLIELLVVVAIMGLLISILLPSMGEARRQSKRAMCMNNLHQVSIGMQSYLNYNMEIFPYIARFPTAEAETARTSDPPRKPYPSLPVALKRETGGNGRLFECPADQNTKPEFTFQRYFDVEKTSYEWESLLNGKRQQFKTLLLMKDEVKVKLKDMWMVYDFEGFHGGKFRMGSQVILYADMSVRYDKWNENKVVGQNEVITP